MTAPADTNVNDVPVGSDDRYGFVLTAILGSLLLMPVLLETKWGPFALLLVFGGTLVLTYRVSRRSLKGWRLLIVLVGAGGVTALVATVLGGPAARGVVLAMAALYVGFAPVVVVSRLLQHERITGATVAGALSVYLLIGQFFTVLYPLIAHIAGSFFAQTHTPGPIDYMYFSFITLATVGYGDLTPAGSAGRIAALTEGLLGQLYLVTVVAVVVGNIGRDRAGGLGSGGDRTRR